MSVNRIVTELYLEKPDFADVSKVARLLEKSGIKTILIPPEDRGMNVHLVAENADLPKVREIMKKLGIPMMEKEVVLVSLEDRPGTLAEVTRKISAAGVNLTYAFSVAMDPTTFYALFGTSDNKKALQALG
jgi:hypothetical protein